MMYAYSTCRLRRAISRSDSLIPFYTFMYASATIYLPLVLLGKCNLEKNVDLIFFGHFPVPDVHLGQKRGWGTW